MFSPSDRTRGKHKTKVDELIAPDRSTEIIYANRAFKMTGPAWGMIAAFVGIMGIGLLLGVLLIPGVVFIVIFMNLVRPARIVAVTPAQMLLISRSMWMSSPKEIIGAEPLRPIAPGSEQFMLAGEELKLTGKEQTRLSAAAAPVAAHAAPQMPVTPGPMAPVASDPTSF